MPKLIDYPRTSYTGAWEVAEVVDDTGGKCALDTAARKLNRKVSGSFKAIVGSAVKFGLLTSKRELLTTTTLFRRIKHAYDKQEELLFHREAFLTPPLFTQLCRKFRSRELPVAMLDVLLIREFSVEEINAQGVAKAFVDGARMVGLLNEHDNMADIDQLAAQQPPRRELASPVPTANIFRQTTKLATPAPEETAEKEEEQEEISEDSDELSTASSAASLSPAGTESAVAKRATNPTTVTTSGLTLPASRPAPSATADAIASLFGLATNEPAATPTLKQTQAGKDRDSLPAKASPILTSTAPSVTTKPSTQQVPTTILFQLQLIGPGINTSLDVVDVDDLALVRGLLDKIERQLRRS